MIRPLRTLLAVGLAASLLSTVGAMTPRPAQAASCILRLRSGTQFCYAPARFAQLNLGAPFAVVDPAPVVTSVTRLHLLQVSVIAGQNRRANQLAFVYGALREGTDLAALPGRSAPPYVLVQELRGLNVPDHRRIGRVSSNGPWVFTAAVQSRRMSLIVTSNLARDRVQAIGTRLLSAALPGK